MSYVWVIETGYYSDRYIMGVADSVEAAAAYVRSRYGEPYIVAWSEPTRVDDDNWTMVGRFKTVPGYSGDNDSDYDFTRYALVSLTAA